MASQFKTCSVDGCNGKHVGRGFCKKHHERFRRHGDPHCVKPKNLKHGMSGTHLYIAWVSMRTRCGHVKGANETAVRHYRDKGIRVCSAWLEFPRFAAWAMEHGYKEGLTIDRLDTSKGYEPGNCRWLSMRDNLKARWGTLRESAVAP